jgi:ubiquitin C-terminal hydrolase
VGVTYWYSFLGVGILIVVLNIPGAKSRSVEPVIAALEQMYDLRMSRNQQDSQEFLHLVTEALSLEDTNLKKKYKAHQTDHQNGNTETEGLYIPPNPFEGELSTQIQCQRCAFQTPWKKEAFTELSIAVPAKVTPSQITLIVVELFIRRMSWKFNNS